MKNLYNCFILIAPIFLTTVSLYAYVLIPGQVLILDQQMEPFNGALVEARDNINELIYIDDEPCSTISTNGGYFKIKAPEYTKISLLVNAGNDYLLSNSNFIYPIEIEEKSLLIISTDDWQSNILNYLDDIMQDDNCHAFILIKLFDEYYGDNLRDVSIEEVEINAIQNSDGNSINPGVGISIFYLNENGQIDFDLETTSSDGLALILFHSQEEFYYLDAHIVCAKNLCTFPSDIEARSFVSDNLITIVSIEGECTESPPESGEGNKFYA